MRRSAALVGLVSAGLSAALVMTVPVAPASAMAAAPARVSATEPSAPAVQRASTRSSDPVKSKKPAGFYPTPGPVFNNPLGGAKSRYRVLDKIKLSIRSVPKGGLIRIMSWNMMSPAAVDGLLDAQRRGVQVRLLMDSTNLTLIPNPSFRRLQSGLAAGDKGRPAKRRSYAKVCQQSCRGERGQAHAKYYLFSRVGQAKRVLMEGSANLTVAAAVNQWNDVYTFVNNKTLYDFAGGVFDQMWKDKPQVDPYVSVSTNRVQLYFSPLAGANYVGDPVQGLLNNVVCDGTGPNTGNQEGHTIVRVAPDVMRNKRGIIAAQQIKKLWDQGCDVRVAYTVLGRDIHDVLTSQAGRGPVPLRHIVQDFDGDGEFDNYFHLKAICINGRIGDDDNVRLVVNGSSNISGASTVSDEQIAIIRIPKAELAYQRYVDYWFTHAPPIHGGVHRTEAGYFRTLMRTGGVNPYAHVDMD